MLAVSTYQSQCLYISGPSCKCLWNVVWRSLLDGVLWPAHHSRCLLVYKCHSLNIHDPVIKDDIYKVEDTYSSSLLAHHWSNYCSLLINYLIVNLIKSFFIFCFLNIWALNYFNVDHFIVFILFLPLAKKPIIR